MAEPSLAESYSRAFAGRLQPGKRAALLVVDMVVAYTDPASPLYCQTASAAVDAAQTLVSAARDANVPVIFTAVEYEPGGNDGGLFYLKAPVLEIFQRGSALGAFAPCLDVRDGEVTVKKYPSAFFGTRLAEQLQTDQIDTLLICGFSTSGCVRASAVDAMSYGFIPLVVGDACADRHGRPHEASLFDLQAKYAEVIDRDRAQKIITGIGGPKP